MSPKNIFNEPLKLCCNNPLTGFYRDGLCRTDTFDAGRHVVCAIMTDEFLQFSRSKGNDLITPRPEYRFPGLKAGDRWCLCALRWKEAETHGMAPLVDLEATAIEALDFIPMETLIQYAWKTNAE
ncbi:hypothetical protein CYPRO_1956 [Cyclonatronum proteinivorum]|uniref:DUF2237 domain-containing protein n=1 Tax=Cyclonatronum proteinivorum TaxID=1457365 RepID=A0A345UL54_9BACT|nr:DUF2237 domain-containing protein [Cyclonatronum proteinivorum]AXJ01206.1 hypothetical protein CYPRO_1956 [Cyclonatronum proteinivorum]